MENPKPDLLWWVGCAPAIDTRAQKTAQAFAKILNLSNVNYAVLGESEQCTGDSARRAGNEFLFNEMAVVNVEILNEVNPIRIVTTCPHCLHTLKNEYPAFGGNYEVIHHTQLIQELLTDGTISIKQVSNSTVTFHDPCFLGRQNNILTEPREAIQATNLEFVELENHGMKSFCCGAGGAQMWKEEEHGNQRVSNYRFNEAERTEAQILTVACPFCMIMLTDAKKDIGSDIEVLDLAELIADSLDQRRLTTIRYKCDY
jgi:Fe-S oxidoreductase